MNCDLFNMLLQKKFFSFCLKKTFFSLLQFFFLRCLCSSASLYFIFISEKKDLINLLLNKLMERKEKEYCVMFYMDLFFNKMCTHRGSYGRNHNFYIVNNLRSGKNNKVILISYIVV